MVQFNPPPPPPNRPKPPEQNVQLPDANYADYVSGTNPQEAVEDRQNMIRLPLWVPDWFPRDARILLPLMILSGTGLLLLIGVCSALTLAIILDPGRRATATPTVTPIPTIGAIFVTATPDPFQTPIFPPTSIPIALNPYESANLAGMQGIQLDIYDPITGQPNTLSTFMANTPQLAQFAIAFNISAFPVPRDLNCPTVVRLNALRQDGSTVAFNVCLKSQSVVLRDIPELNDNDLPMGPYFIDVLRPLLPEAYQRLLD
jgi:hypothetical protein